MKRTDLIFTLLFMALLLFVGCNVPAELPTGNDAIDRAENWIDREDYINCLDIWIIDVTETFHHIDYVLQADCDYDERAYQEAFSAAGYFHVQFERDPLKEWKLKKCERVGHPDYIALRQPKRPDISTIPDSAMLPMMVAQRDLMAMLGFPTALLCVILGGCSISRHRRKHGKSTVLEEASPVRKSSLNLPAGYDYCLTRRRAFTPLQRLLMLGGFLIAALFVGSRGPWGLLLFAVFSMPIVIGIYLVVHFVTTSGRDELPYAQRRMRISPKMQRPGQTQHYWTIDNRAYQDPEMYQQERARPRISYGGKREKEDNP